ncbi:MAG: tRNA (adenosine(37)-N6)-threonylcarbamoyltransferase complex dimerization subunit type 1 TsaB [Chloroflexi bacterium]|nr:tRNA (adenosine(37)-N6)-threonylcarbamoyltransferase complex dimerization subunit type 1 TsaB [Chloroflexota bacterium]
MMELSIDSSTRYACVGLSRQGESLAELAWRSDRNHSVELVPAIQALLGRRAVEFHEIEAVFVAAGPGGFSALRVGMSTAKSLAVALGVPLVSVVTLDVEAQPYLALGAPVVALMEAGRERLYVGTYSGPLDSASPEYTVLSRSSALSKLGSDAVVCGEAVRAIVDQVREAVGTQVRLVDTAPPTRRAGVLAELAYRRWQSGDVDDPATLQPLYLRSSQVEAADRTWPTS